MEENENLGGKKLQRNQMADSEVAGDGKGIKGLISVLKRPQKAQSQQLHGEF